MTRRKMILLVLIVFLALLYSFQLLSENRNKTRNLELHERIDHIEIIHSDGSSITLELRDDTWYIGDTGKAADDVQVSSMLNAMKSIRILNRVSSGQDHTRYGTDENSAIQVRVYTDNRLQRSLSIGNTGLSTQHNYVRIDEGRDIYLASGALRSIFNKTKEALKAPEAETDYSGETEENT